MSETDKVQEGMNTILIVDDDRAIRRTLEKYLGDAGYVVVTASDGESAWERLCEGTADVCLLDLGMPGVDGMEVLRRMHQAWPLDTTPPGVIIISARDDMHTTVQAVKLGAYDYLVKPLDANRIKLTVQRALEQRRTSLTLAHMVAEEREDRGVDSIVGKSEAIREVYKRIGAVATSRATVLIRGESGTGKELVAKAACRTASGNTRTLSNEEAEQLVTALAATRMPYTCPRGRPTMIFTSYRELERKFGIPGVKPEQTYRRIPRFLFPRNRPPLARRGSHLEKCGIDGPRIGRQPGPQPHGAPQFRP